MQARGTDSYRAVLNTRRAELCNGDFHAHPELRTEWLEVLDELDELDVDNLGQLDQASGTEDTSVDSHEPSANSMSDAGKSPAMGMASDIQSAEWTSENRVGLPNPTSVLDQAGAAEYAKALIANAQAASDAKTKATEKAIAVAAAAASTSGRRLWAHSVGAGGSSASLQGSSAIPYNQEARRENAKKTAYEVTCLHFKLHFMWFPFGMKEIYATCPNLDKKANF